MRIYIIDDYINKGWIIKIFCYLWLWFNNFARDFCSRQRFRGEMSARSSKVCRKINLIISYKKISWIILNETSFLKKILSLSFHYSRPEPSIIIYKIAKNYQETESTLTPPLPPPPQQWWSNAAPTNDEETTRRNSKQSNRDQNHNHPPARK